MVNILVYCITLVVVTIPEGVKLAETISVSQSLNKLHKRNTLVRSLQAPEIMARCTDICVEAKGCLLNTKIDIMQIYVGGDTIIPIGCEDDKKKFI